MSTRPGMTANEFAARAGDAGNIADAWPFAMASSHKSFDEMMALFRYLLKTLCITIKYFQLA